jgi:hypothetical protein
VTAIPEPPRIAALHHDKIGRPVPWFVVWLNQLGQPMQAGTGTPDFRIVKPAAAGLAWHSRLCWVCGVLFQRQEPRAWLVGPMCVVNGISSEPPSHYDCALYSVQACPFLTHPAMVRRDKHLPPGSTDPAGTMIMRNPGVTALVVTKYNSAKTTREPGGLLFQFGQPQWVEWWAEGRKATRAEVMASIDTGLPALVDLCEGDPGSLLALDEAHRRAMRLVPQ